MEKHLRPDPTNDKPQNGSPEAKRKWRAPAIKEMVGATLSTQGKLTHQAEISSPWGPGYGPS